MRCFILKDRQAGAEPRQSDEELLDRFHAGDDDAFEIIASRYLGLISSAAKRYRGMSPDIDSGDLVQEGMIALLNACRSYNKNGGMSFKNYSMVCIENRFISLLRHVSSTRIVPSQNIISIEDEENHAVDSTSSTLPEIVETKEYIGSLHQILKDRLSDLEYRVAILHLSGYTRREISDKLNKSLKTIDNAQTRIRQKLSR
ncbi:MAG: sigma-70 family RNA polymerase sigma factor [Ruminococcus sp.]|nr:sigma-70 family RNA polymerase sigma factor [Ruminococcus sp.]